MRLSDVMSHAGLALYAEIALVLFMVAFLAIVLRVMRARTADMERMRRLPLEDASVADPHPGESR